MKIGLFGGTFDPPHNGHLFIAAEAMKTLGLAEVRFVPAARPPHKQDGTAASPEDRSAMIERAIAGHPGFSVSRVEFQRAELSYTAVTLAGLSKNEPGNEWFLLIGMDNALEFHLWRDPEAILDVATVVALTRPGFDRSNVAPEFRARFVYCETTLVPISSTEIRNLAARGESITGIVPAAVEEYITEHGLYRRI